MKTEAKSFLAFSFGAGFNSPNIPIATFRQGNKELNFVIDTGSDRNVIDNAVLKDIEHKSLDHKISLTGVGGSQVAESCSINFTRDGDSFTADFLISDMTEAFTLIKKLHAIQLHGLLGATFLKEHKIVLDFTNMVAHNQG